MITYHALRIMIVYITRILIQQMLHLIIIVKHQHHRDNGKLTTSTRSKIGHSTFRVCLDGSNKPFYITTGNRLTRFLIHLTSILVSGIMRKVATDNEKIVVIEIRLQHLRHSFQLRIVIRRNDNGNDWRNIPESTL